MPLSLVRAALALWFVMSVITAGGCAKGPHDDADEEADASDAPSTEIDLWAGVPPLVPEADDIAPVLEPRPGPAKPPSVGETIEKPFPPKTREPAGGASAVPTGPLKVERFGPQGEQALVDAVRLSFDQPMVPLAAVEALQAKAIPLEIDPPLSGTPRWLGTRTLAYFADNGRIPYSTSYTVTVPAGIESTNGAKLDDPVTWSFQTPSLQLESSVPAEDADNVVLQPRLELRFNQAIERTALRAALQLRGGGQAIELVEIPIPPLGPAAKQPEAWQRARTIALVPKTELRPDTRYELRLPAGVYGEGPNRSATIRVSFRTYPPLRLSKSKCNGPCWASHGISLQSTTPIADPKLSDKVHVEPAVADLVVASSYGGIHLSGSFVGDTTYRVEVDAGVTDTHGQALAKPFRASIRLGPQYPALSLVSSGRNPGVLERSGKPQLPLVVAGLDQLEIHSRALAIDDVRQFLDAGTGRDWTWPEHVPELDHHSTIDVAASRKTRQRIGLDLGPMLDGNQAAWLVIRSNEYRIGNWTSRSGLTQMVQVTDLAPSAALDRNGGLIQVTRLSTSDPVMAARVKIIDRRGAEIWTGLTDPTGLAYPTYDLTGHDPQLLVVEREGDAAFVRLDRGDLRGQWVGSWNRHPEATPRAFFFTDRTPYKPGETIHLVGMLRLETPGPQGGVESWIRDASAKYKVVTPRGIDVAEGDVRIGPFGTFSVDIETDENGDTGDYRFTLTVPSLFTSDRTFYHSIPVETFRAPEFEVEVARPSSVPLRFGDDLVAEVRGRYLHGAPLVGGQVEYVLRRSPTAFSPPKDANGAFTFGLGGWASPWGRRGYDRHIMPAHFGSTVAKQGDGALDEQGVLEVSHRLRVLEPEEAKKRKEAGTTDEPVPQTTTFSLEATVTDRNLQAIAGNASFVVHPAEVYVGLRSDRTVLREGERTQVEAVVVDLEGERVAGHSIALEVLRQKTERTPVEKDGVWTFEYETKEESIQSCDLVSTAAPVTCAVTAAGPGTYLVRATTKDDDGHETRTETRLYVHGKDAVVWDETRNRVDLVPDKTEYAPGETATVLLRSPFSEARGLVVVERDGIKQRVPVWVRGGAFPVEIPISEDMLPHVTVSALLVRGRVEVEGAPPDQDLGMPQAAVGQVELTVSSDHKRVAVELEPTAREISPKESLGLTIRTKDGNGNPMSAAVAVMVVDEAVLSLMGFETPDPLPFFHHARPGGVALHALHASVLPQQTPPSSPSGGDVPEQEEQTIGLGEVGLIGHGGGGGTGSGFGRGAGGLLAADEAAPAEAPAPVSRSRRAKNGDGAVERKAKRRPMAQTAAPSLEGRLDASKAMAQPVSLRTLFATTAFFDADVRTDENGMAEISIPMPENLTTFRVMVVAIDPERPDRFGNGDTTVRVRKPVMVRPSLPRFANFGDRFEGSVMVDNQTGENQAVLVGTRGLNVEISGATEKMVQIPAGESREVRFDFATQAVGDMRLQFAAMSNAGRDATELSLPVYFPATAKAFADYGMTDGSIQRTVEPPNNALAAFGGLELTFSSTALSGLEDAVEYLVDYPYECAEQTASRILPIFVLGKILEQFPIAELGDQTRRDALAKDGIERLLDKQNYDGGFGFWRKGESWPYLTNWVTFALLEGKRAGYEIDASALERALSYVENFVQYGDRTRWGVYYDWTSRAFGLWLLSGESRGSALFDRVWSHRDEMPLYARAQLMAAAHRYGKTAQRDRVLEELREAAVESSRTIHFAESRSEAASQGLRLLMHSNVQTDAIVLAALLEVAPADPMLSKIMAGIMADRDPQRGGRWLSTHANAWALLAASRYYETVEKDEPDYVARTWIDAKFAGEHAFLGRSMATVEQRIPMATLLGEPTREVTVAKEGAGKLYYRLGLRYAPEDLKLDAIDNGFTVYRTYEALGHGDEEPEPDAVKRLDDGSWQIKAGTNVKVTIHLVVRDRVNYLVVDDPLPAGFEGQNPRFLTSVGTAPEDTGPIFTRTTGRHTRWWYPWWTFDHTQMRDDRMLLFADHLPAGVYTYAYTARATTRGEFQLSPIKAEAMYEPEIFGHSSSAVVHVVD